MKQLIHIIREIWVRVHRDKETIDLLQVDGLNIAGMMHFVVNIIWFPASVYEIISWIIGSLVGLSLVALNSNGTRDTAFNAGPGFNGSTYDVSISPNGSLVVGGLFTTLDGLSRLRVAKLQ